MQEKLKDYIVFVLKQFNEGKNISYNESKEKEVQLSQFLQKKRYQYFCIGQIIQGQYNKYLILNQFQIGGNSIIWLVVNQNCQIFILKQHRNNQNNQNDEKEQELDIEYDIQEKIQYKYILEKFYYDDNLIYILDFYGPSLEEMISFIHGKKNISKINKEGFFMNIFKQLIQQVNCYQKNNIIHTDIKLDNILVSNISEYQKQQFLQNYLIHKKFDRIYPLSMKYVYDIDIDVFKEELDKFFNKENEDENEDEKQENEQNCLCYKWNGLQIPLNSDIKVILIDFGNAEYYNDQLYGSFCPVEYRALESQLHQNIDFKIDVFALGCIFFELYTNKSLFDCDFEDETGEQQINMFWQIISAQKPHDINNILNKKNIQLEITKKKYVQNIYKDSNCNTIDDDILNCIQQKHKSFQKQKKQQMKNDYLFEIIQQMIHYDKKQRLSIEQCVDIFKVFSQ